MTYDALPDDGVMLLHTITRLTLDEVKERGIPLSMDAARFAMFIATEIFRGGQLPTIGAVEQHATAAASRSHASSRCSSTTRGRWTHGRGRWMARRDEAIAIQSEEVYDRYMRYLTGCADMFRKGYIDVNQFTLQK